MVQRNLVGQKVLGYTVKEKLGSGAFGTVYRVEKVNAAGNFVRALKHITFPTQRQYNSLLNSMGGDVEKVDLYFSRMQKNILSEVQILNKLSESGIPHVVRYYESDIQVEDEPKHYDIFILMEYLTALDDFLLENTFTVRDVVLLGEDILEGLAACHACDVIHRDIKNENIFVYANQTTGEREYKIGDFGIAKEMRGSSRAESAKGTPDFLAPEVFSGKKGYTKSVDLYSLGIVLYCLLNYSRGPFLPRYPAQYFGDDEEDAFQRRMDGEIPDMPSLGGKALGRVIIRAVSGEAERFTSAEEFLGALRRAVGETDNETLETVVQIQGTIHRKPTEREKTAHDLLPDEPDREVPDRKAGVQGPFYSDPVSDLSLYGTLRCRDYELEKDREWQVSTPEGMISVKLPRDIRDGQKIPYLGKGRMDPHTGQRGTLYVTLQIERTTFLQRYRSHLLAGGGAAAVLLVVLGIVAFFGGKTPEPMPVSQSVATNPPLSVQREPTKPVQTETRPVVTEAPVQRIDIAVGDTIPMGTYPQMGADDYDAPVDWMVLDVRGNEALVVSKLGIDCQPYHSRLEDVTWEDSSIRGWLNGVFYKAAFTSDEQEKIIKQTVPAEDNPIYDTYGGSDTEDKIFLLSLSEVEHYLGSNGKRMCIATPYAVGNNAFVSSSDGGCWWLLRTPGETGNMVVSTNTDGSLDYDGGKVNSSRGVVRPAMWIRID